ncbi:hypothetical protein [Helicobacter pylori]|uniref:hypothetical protein n=1 Tax=Helicobacter pylori TaxID=210 RepID=UPI001FD3AFF4|nr:hypothetical protein [Helicobacter pylori]UOR44525.1 hypothetical protein MPG32_05000 [Helicobacter pylori]
MSFYDKMRAKTIKQSFKNPFFKKECQNGKQPNALIQIKALNLTKQQSQNTLLKSVLACFHQDD